MSQLNPQQTYPLVYQIFPTDSATYYIRAIIRLSNTGQIWKTVNLTNSGGNRYTGSYITPNDGPMGQPIDITYYVYTDTGYTTLSQAYDCKNVEHLVATLFNPSAGFSAGSDGLTKEDVTEIIRAEIKGQQPSHGLELDKHTMAFRREMEPYFQTFHDSITELHEKSDAMKSELVKYEDIHGGAFKNFEKLHKLLEDYVLKSAEKDGEQIKRLEERLRKMNEDFVKLISSGRTVSDKKIERMSAEMRRNFDKIQELKQEPEKELAQDEEPTDDYIVKAKRLLGVYDGDNKNLLKAKKLLGIYE